jgi:hypothetical protein
MPGLKFREQNLQLLLEHWQTINPRYMNPSEYPSIKSMLAKKWSTQSPKARSHLQPMFKMLHLINIIMSNSCCLQTIWYSIKAGLSQNDNIKYKYNCEKEHSFYSILVWGCKTWNEHDNSITSTKKKKKKNLQTKYLVTSQCVYNVQVYYSANLEFTRKVKVKLSPQLNYIPYQEYVSCTSLNTM